MQTQDWASLSRQLEGTQAETSQSTFLSEPRECVPVWEWQESFSPLKLGVCLPGTVPSMPLTLNAMPSEFLFMLLYFLSYYFRKSLNRASIFGAPGGLSWLSIFPQLSFYFFSSNREQEYWLLYKPRPQIFI